MSFWCFNSIPKFKEMNWFGLLGGAAFSLFFCKCKVQLSQATFSNDLLEVRSITTHLRTPNLKLFRQHKFMLIIVHDLMKTYWHHRHQSPLTMRLWRMYTLIFGLAIVGQSIFNYMSNYLLKNKIGYSCHAWNLPFDDPTCMIHWVPFDLIR